MADILRLSAARQPEKVNLPAIQRFGLYTHFSPINEDRLERGLSVAAKADDLPFEAGSISEVAQRCYSELTARAADGDLRDVIEIANSYVKSRGVFDLSHLDASTHLALRHLGSFEAFCQGGRADALKEVGDPVKFFASTAPEDMGRLSNMLLCGAIIGVDSEILAALSDFWRSLGALIAANATSGGKTPSDQAELLARQIFLAPIHLPRWFFRMRSCQRPSPRNGDGTAFLHLDKIDAFSEALLRRQEEPTQTTKDRCSCKCDDICRPQNPTCVCITPFQANYYLLKDQLQCYVPAELAYIEVVAAGETRKRTHERRDTVEVYFEEENTLVQKEDRDLQMTDRSTLHTEIEKHMQASLDASAKVKGKYGAAGEFEVTTNGKLSRSSTEKMVRDVFREAVSKAAYSMQKTTRTLRKERRQTETVETNKHVFQNTTDTPMVTKYFYVNQQRKAQVYDYGMRLIVELLIPCPAALFEALWRKRVKSTFHLVEPTEPMFWLPGTPNHTLQPSDITAANHLAIANAYGISVDAPPAPTVTVTAQASSDSGGPTIAIPAGYEAQSVWVCGSFDPVQAKGRGDVDFSIGDVSFSYDEEKGDHGEMWSGCLEDGAVKSLTPNLSGSVSVGVAANDMESWSATVSLECVPTAAALAEWRQQVFDKAKAAFDEDYAAYLKERAAYDAALAEHLASWEAKLKERHPFFNRETAHTEIKRSSIYLMCQSFQDLDPMIWRSEPCGLPEMDRPRARKHGREAYFWDRAFDWDLMSYILFDYFWNPMCKWEDNFDVDHPDAMFRSFLQAGYARVQVPVAEGMEEDVEWYLLTGQKWGQTGKPPLDASDPRWRSIALELKLQRGCRQDDRPGTVDLNLTQATVPTMTDPRKVRVLSSDYYLDANGAVDQAVIDFDIDREIYIDFVQYRIVAIAHLGGRDWEITLDRSYEGDLTRTPFHTVGARFVGAPFMFEVPTDLTWASKHGSCLPCYPVTCEE